MSADALALLSALCFGLAHFFNGLLSRRASSTAVALAGQLGGTALILALTPLDPGRDVGPEALAWGALSGVGTGIGVGFLYRAMSRGRFSVVVPLSDVAAVTLPVLVGVALLGDRPGWLAWCGIACAPFALWLVSRSREADADANSQVGAEPLPGADSPAGTNSPAGGGRTASGAGDALIAGLGFALQFIALGRTGPEAGLWPLVLSRVVSVLALLPLLALSTGRVRLSPTLAWLSAGAGALGTLAITLYTLATREQLLSLAVVLTSLYPALPVLLGVIFLRERLTRAQTAGLLCAAASIALISR
ncbi:EamA family transporter [Streptomyces sp. ODS28]|uniref:EamA family transporter n=1 Tax=Streptomyces sp. ODS28 TaxID=3136688 RepID=UPI0031E636E7